MAEGWVGPACCSFGLSFWLVQPFALHNIWFASATGKPNHFNKTGRKRNAFQTPQTVLLAWFLMNLLIKSIILGYRQRGHRPGRSSKCVVWWTTPLQLSEADLSFQGSEITEWCRLGGTSPGPRSWSEQTAFGATNRLCSGIKCAAASASVSPQQRCVS